MSWMGWSNGWTVLPTLPSGGDNFAYAISDTGVVVGSATNASGILHPVSWTQAGGIVDLGLLAGAPPDAYGEAYSVSADGTTIVGYAGPSSNRQAFRWTAGGGMTALETNFSVGRAASSDGTVVAGNFGANPFVWTQADGIILNSRPGFVTAGNVSLSPDGTILVMPDMIGNYWRWTQAGGWTDTGVATTALASWSAGPMVGNDGTIFQLGGSATDAQVLPIVLSGALVTIATPPGGVDFAFAAASTLDRSTRIVGYYSGGSGLTAWHWTASGGVVSIANPGGYANPNLDTAARQSMSSDGRAFVATINDIATNGTHGAVYVFASGPLPTTRVPTPPKVFLRWSDDGGRTFGNPVGISMGDVGEYLTSHQWQRLGMGRRRVFEIFWSGATATSLQGAWIDTTPAQS